MIIHAGCDIITRMDISLLSTTNDIEQLRTLALAMVQNAVSENAEKEEKLRQQNTTLQQRILLLEEALKVATLIAGKSVPISMMVKESVNRAFEVSLSEGVRFERRVFHAAFATLDQKEGMAAFIAKRPAQFTGQ